MNRLAQETSPYLLQHAENPVDWYAWGPEAFAAARERNKPILLSVGYAACHWCHVMAHESFENEAIAALINEHFVPVKLDREERPDLDQLYQHALALLGQQGGWPLTMFLTPKAEPFWGGTYFPPEQRWGRPGFGQVLQAVSRAYGSDSDMVANNVRALMDGLAPLGRPQAGGAADPNLPASAGARLARQIDRVHGGFGSAPKFPQVAALMLIWRAAARLNSDELRAPVLLTLDRMAQGGIYDHLGGGFARYSTDEAWLAPHFEKMLYDNALLIELLCAAYTRTGSRLYAARVEETIGWLLREMRRPEGAFAAAIDADSEHEEGKFYVWSEAEIDALLGVESAFFKACYDVTPGGNWEHKTILNRSARPDLLGDDGETQLTAARALLFAARESRIRPGLDHKILADWNGLAIAALARAAALFGRADWLAAAKGAFDFVADGMAAPDGRLLHSYCGGRTHPGTLDDHAFMARAALVLGQVTGDPVYRARAEGWIAALDREYRESADAAYQFAARDADDLLVRLSHAIDGPVPSGNGVMVEVLASLYHLTGEDRWRQEAENLIAALSGELSQSPFSMAGLLNGIDQLHHARTIVVVAGEGADPAAVWRYAGPADLVIAGAEGLAPEHPAYGKVAQGGQTSFYVCHGQVCSAPFTDPALINSAAAG